MLLQWFCSAGVGSVLHLRCPVGGVFNTFLLVLDVTPAPSCGFLHELLQTTLLGHVEKSFLSFWKLKIMNNNTVATLRENSPGFH